MGKAMEMTPAMKAFIKGEAETTASVAVKEIETSEVAADTKAVESQKNSTPRATRRAGRRAGPEMPGASEILDQVLVPITIRVQHRTAHSLRRAHLEQRLSNSKPDTQQEIVEDALSDWLGKHGFLE